MLIDKYVETFPGCCDLRKDVHPRPERVAQVAADARRERELDAELSDEEPLPSKFWYGWLGQGKPLWVGSSAGGRHMREGGGLCSPGRWRPDARRFPFSSLWSAVAELIWKLAVRKRAMVQSPVIPSEVARLRSEIEGLLGATGIDFREQDGDLKCTPVRWRLLKDTLQAAQDPDATALGEFAAGVNLGVTERLQRTHAVFLPKRKWKIAGQAEGDSRQHQFPELTGEQNYKSAQEHVDALEPALEEDLVPSAGCETARTFKLTERQAREPFGNECQVAKLEAWIKDVDPDGRVTVRVLHDGTNSLSVNSHIKVRDAECSPTASDIKRMLRLKSEMGLRMVGSTTDIKSAHRLIPVSRRDWGHLGCRIRPGGDLYFNRVQTFGISSASTYFAR